MGRSGGVGCYVRCREVELLLASSLSPSFLAVDELVVNSTLRAMAKDRTEMLAVLGSIIPRVRGRAATTSSSSLHDRCNWPARWGAQICQISTRENAGEQKKRISPKKRETDFQLLALAIRINGKCGGDGRG